MKRQNVLGTSISIGNYQSFIDEIFMLVRNHVPSYICFANVHMVMEGVKHSDFQKIVNTATLVAPDGKPLSFFLKYLENINQDRVCGMDILPDILKQADQQNKSVYFYGGAMDLLNSIVSKAKREFPNLRICGVASPPFRKLTVDENVLELRKITEAAPDIVFVSLGCPKQETWMATNRLQLGTCLLGVGQAFRVYAGIEKRLPVWMRNLSLEWMYRLYQEPARLWRRYLSTNSYFMILVLMLILSRMTERFSAPFYKLKAHGMDQKMKEQ